MEDTLIKLLKSLKKWQDRLAVDSGNDKKVSQMQVNAIKGKIVGILNKEYKI